MPEAAIPPLADSLSRLTPGQRILSVAAEMHRARNWMERRDLEEMRRCYARALDLMDRLCGLADRPKALGEYRRWRELTAGLFIREIPSMEEHKLLEDTLILLHPESWNAFFTPSAA